MAPTSSSSIGLRECQVTNAVWSDSYVIFSVQELSQCLLRRPRSLHRMRHLLLMLSLRPPLRAPAPDAADAAPAEVTPVTPKLEKTVPMKVVKPAYITPDPVQTEKPVVRGSSYIFYNRHVAQHSYLPDWKTITDMTDRGRTMRFVSGAAGTYKGEPSILVEMRFSWVRDRWVYRAMLVLSPGTAEQPSENQRVVEVMFPSMPDTQIDPELGGIVRAVQAEREEALKALKAYYVQLAANASAAKAASRVAGKPKSKGKAKKKPRKKASRATAPAPSDPEQSALLEDGANTDSGQEDMDCGSPSRSVSPPRRDRKKTSQKQRPKQGKENKSPAGANSTAVVLYRGAGHSGTQKRCFVAALSAHLLLFRSRDKGSEDLARRSRSRTRGTYSG